ncbi:unnamed protein product [Protopolystoma xenopodis]|uniref:Uncharacterized protein n=1 Tax=Protopolystoma xenopodis TaxID=117903 RepID=A0A3S5BK50_9PLAT|nr:unnamed protein product [Protopolystoma xenopodis]
MLEHFQAEGNLHPSVCSSTHADINPIACSVVVPANAGAQSRADVTGTGRASCNAKVTPLSSGMAAQSDRTVLLVLPTLGASSLTARSAQATLGPVATTPLASTSASTADAPSANSTCPTSTDPLHGALSRLPWRHITDFTGLTLHDL